MRVALIAVGERVPGWVAEAWSTYAARLPRDLVLGLVEVPAGRRAKGADAARLVDDEGRRLLAAVPPGARVVALDRTGDAWSTEDLAGHLAAWRRDGREVCLLVGGPDGLSAACLARAEARWSLSRLTLPHAMVRVVVAEQLYRAWSMLQNHPYHR
ncbi:23S rRNA (pseudouridine(1915)-N(3))-methyltransferase RlmH [bacterium]|nr:MAG: 23S rRNA (pseudouridine(1915)-N(3))-methyltransferase RlmH [bacterium]